MLPRLPIRKQYPAHKMLIIREIFLAADVCLDRNYSAHHWNAPSLRWEMVIYMCKLTFPALI